MDTSRLKSLLITACCLVFALFAKSQAMDDNRSGSNDIGTPVRTVSEMYSDRNSFSGIRMNSASDIPALLLKGGYNGTIILSKTVDNVIHTVTFTNTQSPYSKMVDAAFIIGMYGVTYFLVNSDGYLSCMFGIITGSLSLHGSCKILGINPTDLLGFTSSIIALIGIKREAKVGR